MTEIIIDDFFSPGNQEIKFTDCSEENLIEKYIEQLLFIQGIYKLPLVIKVQTNKISYNEDSRTTELDYYRLLLQDSSIPCVTYERICENKIEELCERDEQIKRKDTHCHLHLKHRMDGDDWNEEYRILTCAKGIARLSLNRVTTTIEHREATPPFQTTKQLVVIGYDYQSNPPQKGIIYASLARWTDILEELFYL